MDILYISPSTSQELTRYCDDNLIAEVTGHFAKNAKVMEKDNNTHPSRWWVVTDYITDETTEFRKKASVILSFAAIGGFVQIGDRIEQGDVNVLNMLRDTKNISDEDFDFFVDAFYNFSHGNGVKFTV